MAVTIHSSPQKYTPSDNPILWRFSSNQTGQANFSYVVELYVNNFLVGNYQYFPTSGIYAVADMMKKVRNLVPSPVLSNADVIKNAFNNTPVYIKVFERYGTTPVNHSSATSSDIYVFKGCLPAEEFENFVYTDYKMLLSTSKWMTDSVNDLAIRLNHDYYLTFIADTITNFDVNITLYDVDGNGLTTLSYTNSTNKRIVQLNVNTSLYSAYITDAVDSIGVQIDDYTNIVMTEKRFYIDRDCDNGKQLIWLNKYGGFDQFNFAHNDIESTDVESQTFERSLGEWVGTSFVLNSANSGVQTYLKTAKKKRTLISEYIDGSTQNWLMDSVAISPQAYIFGTTNQKVNVITASYPKQQDKYEEEFTAVIELLMPNIIKSAVI